MPQKMLNGLNERQSLTGKTIYKAKFYLQYYFGKIKIYQKNEQIKLC